MCGRFALTASADQIADLFSVPAPVGLEPHYNIAPTSRVLAVRMQGGMREATRMRWGLIPRWAKDVRIGARMINARSETVASKPAFRSAYAKRRCLVVADGFYEWQRVGRDRLPYLFRCEGGGPFAMAGIWEAWRNPEGERIESCAILTTAANDRVAPIHERMPVILPIERWDDWLSSSTDAAGFTAWLRPFPGSMMTVRRVSRFVNNARNGGPRCQESEEEASG